jgi:hypothetical protein
MANLRKACTYLALMPFVFYVVSGYAAEEDCDCTFSGFTLDQYDRLSGQWGKVIDIENNEVPEYLNWNSINRSNFVVAEISGPKNFYKKDISVSVTGLKDGVEFLHQDFMSIYFDMNGQYFIPILMHDAFCVPIQIKFELHYKKHLLDRQNIKMDFACGE